MEQFKYLGKILTDQNSVQEEIKSKLKSGECLLSFCAESVFNLAIQKLKNSDIRTTILTVVLYGCETWSLTLREEHRLRLLRGIFVPKRDEVTREWRKLHTEELNDCIPHPILLR